MGARRARLKRQRLAEQVARLRHAATPHEQDAEPGQGRRVLGVELQGAAIGLFGLLHAPLGGLDVGKTAGGGGAGGIGQQRPEEAGLRLLAQALGQEQGAEVGVGRGRRRVGLSGAAHQFDGVRRAPLGGPEDPQIMQGQGLFAVDPERRFVELGGRIDGALRMPGESILQQGLQIGGGLRDGRLEGQGRRGHGEAWRGS